MMDLQANGGDPRAMREAGGLLTFGDVEEQLIEAVRCLWRLPDRERSWQRVRSCWPAFSLEGREAQGDYADADAAPRPLPLSRAELGAMERALGWLSVAQGDDGRLIGMVIEIKARGAARVPWMRLLRRMGVRRGADGLRKRYGRAMERVVKRANANLSRADGAIAGEIVSRD